jgi:hypothetical protein
MILFPEDLSCVVSTLLLERESVRDQKGRKSRASFGRCRPGKEEPSKVQSQSGYRDETIS